MEVRVKKYILYVVVLSILISNLLASLSELHYIDGDLFFVTVGIGLPIYLYGMAIYYVKRYGFKKSIVIHFSCFTLMCTYLTLCFSIGFAETYYEKMNGFGLGINFMIYPLFIFIMNMKTLFFLFIANMIYILVSYIRNKWIKVRC